MTRHTDAELEALLDDKESELAEHRESLTGGMPTKAHLTTCALTSDLLNHHLPGFPFIGVKEDGNNVPMPAMIALS